MPRVVAEEPPPKAAPVVRAHDEPALDHFCMHTRAVGVVDIDRFGAALHEHDVGSAADLEFVKRHERVMLAASGSCRHASAARQGQPREDRSHGNRRKDDPGKCCAALRRRVDRHVDWMRPPTPADSGC